MYWESEVKALFPTAKDIKEDWTAKTVSFSLANHNGKTTFCLNATIRTYLEGIFGTSEVEVVGTAEALYPDQQGADNVCVVTLTVTLLRVKFPKKPGEPQG